MEAALFLGRSTKQASEAPAPSVSKTNGAIRWRGDTSPLQSERELLQLTVSALKGGSELPAFTQFFCSK